MTFLAVILFGISACVILWRYIYPFRYFELINKIKCDRLDVSILKRSEISFDKNHQEVQQLIKIISPQSKSTVFILKPILISALQHFYSIHCRESWEFEEPAYLKKIFDVQEITKLDLCYKKQIKIKEKDADRVPTFDDMEIADVDTIKDTQKADGNHVLEATEFHAATPETELNVQLGKEEMDLNTIIRRLIKAELFKQSITEPNTISRVHSDINSRINWKKNNALAFPKFHGIPTQSVSYSSKPDSFATFSIFPTKGETDVYNLGEKSDSNTEQESVLAENIADDVREEGYDEYDDSDESHVERTVILSKDVLESHEENVLKVLKTIENSKADMTLESNSLEIKLEDAATQTEHMYMIRAVRSCPGSRKRIQRFAVPRGMSKGKSTVKVFPMEMSLPIFLYRKASDNLIYEKGKASQSPSYIPVPERFRWRYVVPRKMN